MSADVPSLLDMSQIINRSEYPICLIDPSLEQLKCDKKQQYAF